ncbi:MAG TPA: AraC family ligand binding domain-containing protein [Noviherbaspirillum sp.]|nr:AraC family ligand binding domain-containing protein [Noviherbaspirillum sp.]
MQREEFLARLAEDGFKEVVTVEREANGAWELHAHPFEAKALILRGEIRLRRGEEERTYPAGTIFHLAADEPHSEWYGPQGVTYLVGRR